MSEKPDYALFLSIDFHRGIHQSNPRVTMYILVVEDDESMRNMLEIALAEAGHVVSTAAHGLRADAAVRSNQFDLIVLDIRIPGIDGLTLLKSWRASGIQTPTLMLTGLDNLDDKVEGLDAGADDYLTKPFSFEELLARIRALQRRGSNLVLTDDFERGDLLIDHRRREAKIGGIPLNLRLKEYDVLQLLGQKYDSVVTRMILAERVWGGVFGVSDDVINNTISSLRKKMISAGGSDSGVNPIIRTVRGRGYMLTHRT